MEYDIFLSHASEDKDSFVRPLAECLRHEGFKLWYDEFELIAGDSLIEKIDYGLANSKAGVVVLSKSFFEKAWPQHEIRGLRSRYLYKNTTLIPIWFGISLEEIIDISPPLADIKAIDGSLSSDSIVKEIRRVVEPSEFGFNTTTIEEANDLLHKGEFDFSALLSVKALDSRLYFLACVFMPNHRFNNPEEGLISLSKMGVLNFGKDEEESKKKRVRFEYLLSALENWEAYYMPRHDFVSKGHKNLSHEESEKLLFEIRKFLKRNPLIQQQKIEDKS